MLIWCSTGMLTTSSKTRKARQHLVVTAVIRTGAHYMGIAEQMCIYIYIYKSRNENVKRHRKMLFQIYTWYKGNVEVKYYNTEKIHKVKL